MRAFRRYGITALVGLLIALPIWLKDGLFVARESQRLLKALSNGAFLAAVLLLGAGLMGLISGQGLFDAFRYTLQGILRGLLPGRQQEKRESFADYREARRSRKGSFSHLIVVGLVFFLVALVAALLFERGYVPPA